MLDYGVVDTHVHLWNEDDAPCVLSPVLGNYGRPEEYKEACGCLKVDKYVFMEVARNEQDYLLECKSIAKMAQEDPRLRAFVAWAPLSSGGDHAARALEHMCREYPLVKGIRQAFFFEPDGATYSDPKFIEGVLRLPEFGLSFAIGSSFSQDRNVIKFLEKTGGKVKMVLDHMGKPPVTEGLFEEWAGDIDEIAAFPNVSVKLSSVASGAADVNWDYEDIAKYIRHSVKAFGLDRLLYGSDYPISGLKSDLVRQMETLLKALRESGLTDGDLYKVFVTNPCMLYNI